MIYRFFHWEVRANTHREFVERLWLDSLTNTPSVKVWMEEVADRAFKAYGDMIRTYNVNVFVSDTIKAGYLRIEASQEN